MLYTLLGGLLPGVAVQLAIGRDTWNYVNGYLCPSRLVCSGSAVHICPTTFILEDCGFEQKKTALGNIPKEPGRILFATLAKTSGVRAKGCRKIVYVVDWYGCMRVCGVRLLSQVSRTVFFK